MDFVFRDLLSSMNVSKSLIVHLLSAVFGFISSFIFWSVWSQSIAVAVTDGVVAVGPLAVIISLFLLSMLVQIGAVGILLPYTYKILFVFLLWGLGVTVGAFLLPVFVRVLFGLATFCLCMLCDYALYNRSKLLVKPVLSLIVPSFLKIWMVGLTVLLAASLAINPDITMETVDIEIPTAVWEQLWNAMGASLELDGDQAVVKGASKTVIIPLTQQDMFAADEYTLVQSEFAQNGFALPDFDELLQRFQDSGKPGLDYQGFTDSLNQDLSTMAKSQTEQLLGTILDPFRSIWPYLIALSFLVSSQILIPLFVLFGVVSLKAFLSLLSKVHITKLVEEEGTITKYVLQ